MTKVNKSKPISLRLGPEEEEIMSEMQAKYHIYNRSEVLRLALRKMKYEGKIDVLPKLCGVCSAVNNILENSNTDETTKSNLGEELCAVWNQL